jgi:hypothetical protein
MAQNGLVRLHFNSDNPVRDMTRSCAHQSTMDSSHHSPEDRHGGSGQLQNLKNPRRDEFLVFLLGLQLVVLDA